MRGSKNISYAFSGLMLQLLFVFLLPFSVQAQNDTTILADTLLQEIKEETYDHKVSEDEVDEETPINYFTGLQDYPETRSVIHRHVPDSIVKSMQQHKDFWYANAEFKEEEKPDEDMQVYIPLGKRQWVQTLLWLIIIGGFAAAIMWYLAGSNVGLFRKKDSNLQTVDETGFETEDIFAINYQKEIDKAEAGNNFRLATRLMFLRLLKDMAEKNIIQYKPDRTNLQYLFQLQSSRYYDQFFQVTRNYEYSWYGQFEVGEDAYRIIKKDFNQINNLIR